MDQEYTDKFLATTRPTATDASSNDLQTVLHAAYAAIIRGDFEAIGEFMTDDVELNICGFRAIDGNGAAAMTWLLLRGRTTHS